jgi:3',5'-cyclic AMP phosphodiesterase CpdA
MRPAGGACLVLVLALTMLPAATARASVSVLVGAGDIARCATSGDEATAALIEAIGGTVFTVGDNAYPDGSAQHFAECYGPSWGRFRTRTRPSPGNHEYKTADAAGYFDYFRWRAGPGDRGYYAYNRGSWRIYSLNSEAITTEQLAWLESDLAANPTRCSLAYWHRPLFSSGQHGNQSDTGPIWDLLYSAGTELVINGHDHDYERFYPQRPDGSRYWKGIRQFVVGTGGGAIRPFATVQPNSAARKSGAYGVLKLVLKDTEYRWRFITTNGSFVDTGSGVCHGRH